MSLLVVRAGLHDTIQDRGRFGARHLGVPVSGPFDQCNHALANALVGNQPGAAAIEITLRGGVYRAEAPLAVALAGAPMEAWVERVGGDRFRIDPPVAWTLAAGERLRIASARVGVRAYLAVRGGWQSKVILGSRSTEEPLCEGDRIAAETSTTLRRTLADALASPPAESGRTRLRIVAGPDSAELDRGFDWNGLLYQISPASNRMGLRLSGPPIRVGLESTRERVSAPVAPGAVQVAGSQPLILGPACGTIGGYPHVAHVITADFHLLGQARPGAFVEFDLVTIEAARAAEVDRHTKWREVVARVGSVARGEGFG